MQQRVSVVPFASTQGIARSSTKQLLSSSQSPHKAINKYEKATRAIIIAEREAKSNHRRVTSKDLLSSTKKAKAAKEAGLQGHKTKMLGFATSIVNSSGPSRKVSSKNKQ